MVIKMQLLDCDDNPYGRVDQYGFYEVRKADNKSRAGMTGSLNQPQCPSSCYRQSVLHRWPTVHLLLSGGSDLGTQKWNREPFTLCPLFDNLYFNGWFRLSENIFSALTDTINKSPAHRKQLRLRF
jgi:hypothetical protein